MIKQILSLLNKVATKENFKYIIIILTVLIVYFIVFGDNTRKFLIKSLGGYTLQETIVRIDTLEIDIDTTLIIDKWLSANVDLLEPKVIKDTSIYIVKDTLINDTIISIYPVIEIGELFKYENTVSDSLLDGIITTVIDFNKDKLLSQNFDYKPKFPIIITKTIPIVKTIEKEYRNPYNIGLGGKLNSLGDIGVIGAYQGNKGWQFQGGYNFARETDNYIEIGIVKFF